jgi:hypothetical protein
MQGVYGLHSILNRGRFLIFEKTGVINKREPGVSIDKSKTPSSGINTD